MVTNCCRASMAPTVLALFFHHLVQEEPADGVHDVQQDGQHTDPPEVGIPQHQGKPALLAERLVLGALALWIGRAVSRPLTIHVMPSATISTPAASSISVNGVKASWRTSGVTLDAPTHAPSDAPTPTNGKSRRPWPSVYTSLANDQNCAMTNTLKTPSQM